MVVKTDTVTRPASMSQAGFTLIELIVGMAVAVIVMVAAFTILTTTSKSLQANERIVDTQHNLRVAMELLVRDLKLAGFGNPGVAIGGCSNPINPADQTPTAVDSGPDSVQLLVPTTRATGANRWTLRNATPTGGISQIFLQPGAVQDMVTSGLVANTSYVSIGGSATAKVTAYDQSAGTLNVVIPPPLWFQVEDPVYLLQCIRYQVVSAPDPGNLCGGVTPCLTRGVAGATGPTAEAAIAEGIEELQLSYACDGCVTAINSGIPNKVIDDQNASNTFDQADFLSNVPWTAAPLTPDKIKLVQVAMVARQSNIDQGFGETSRKFVGSTALAVPGGDRTLPADPNHRRRMLVRTVETRNVGL